MDSDEHTARTQTHFRAHPHAPALPRLRTFARIPTSQPPHAYALLRPTLRSGFAPSAYLRPHSHPRAAPRLRTFVRIPTHEPPYVRAPSSALPPTNRATSAHLRPHSYARAAPYLCTSFLFSTYFFNRFYVLSQPLLHTCSTNHLKYLYKSFKVFVQIL